MHLVLTDSGLGGLSICAELERRLGSTPSGRNVRLTYVNAWPEDTRGYNDFPDMPSRAAVFDRALARMAAMAPDRILIACNTLSIVYPLTKYSRAPVAPVQGIVDTGVNLFVERLTADPESSIVLLGTKTTVESGAHRDRLVQRGIAPERIVGVACHGLAAAIERDFDGPSVGNLIATAADNVTHAKPSGSPVLVGLCCTHYGYVADRIRFVMREKLERPVQTLDPNLRMVDDLVLDQHAGGVDSDAEGGATATPAGVRVEVVSKVTLDTRTRTGVAGLIEPVSPATARALLSYSHVPDLF